MTTTDQTTDGWLAVLADRDGFVYPTFAQARADLDDDAEMTISVVRGTALPVDDDLGDGLRACSGPYNAGDVAYEIDAYLVDPDDESEGAAVRYAQAQAMAAGLNSADEIERLRAEVAEARAEGRRQAAADIEGMDHELGYAGWKHLENRADEAGYPVEWVRRRRRRDDFTTATIEVAYQYGYQMAAKVARGGAR